MIKVANSLTGLSCFPNTLMLFSKKTVNLSLSVEVGMKQNAKEDSKNNTLAFILNALLHRIFFEPLMPLKVLETKY